MSSAHLPSHWTTTTLLHIVTALEAGKSFRCVEKPPNDEEPGVVKVSAVSWGAFNEQESKTCPSEKQFNPNYQIHPGDLLISRANTIELVGACVIVGSVTKQLMLSDKILRVLVADELKPWILWYLRSRDGRAQIEARSTGNQLSMRNIGQASLLGIQIPLAPARERFQVVEAIESYLTRLDDAMATLVRVQRNLKRYRASVLKDAVEGRLVPTEAVLARAEGREYEPASALLERILVDRRCRWEEAELAKMKARGKVPKNDSWKSKYVEPVAPDTSDLPELPEGWCWATVDSLAWDGGYGTSRKCRPNGEGPPVLRIPNVQNETLTFEDLKFATGSEPLSTDGILAPGDFIFIRTNGSKRLIGRGALVANLLPGDYHFASYLIRLRLASTLMTAKWFALVWHAPIVREQVLRDAASSAGQHNVSLSAALSYCVPLPPHAEQERILAEAERLASIAESSRSTVQPSIARVSRLRQSILKWAFEGRLVDQDPRDEPADVLLERIRAERAAQPSRAHRSRR